MTTSVQAPAPGSGAPASGDVGRRGLRTLLGALAGLLAAAVALGFAELTAALIGPASSPVIVVGDAAITLTPEPVKEFAIRNFGENDKIVLVAGTLVVIALAWRRRPRPARPAALARLAEDHLPGAINIPLEELERRKAELDIATPTVFY